MATTLMWFRRDLRVADNPALLAAIGAGGDGVVPLFVLDDRLWRSAGATRRAYLGASLRSLAERIPLQVVHGDPRDEIPRCVRAVGATSVHAAADFGPYGTRRDRAVEEALGDVPLVRTGSSYAVAPGRIRKDDGSPYQVFTPWFRRWAEHGWRAPAGSPRGAGWVDVPRTVDIPNARPPDGVRLPAAGEPNARQRWRRYLDGDLADYPEVRDVPGADRTSHMSVSLKWGEVHPRTLLADLAERRGDAPAAYRRELAFREFYADVLWHRPDSARDYLDRAYASMRYDDPRDTLDAWREGRTGYPIVDAGMRQLLREGWMHNRVRMIVASFLVKDLHLEWQHGARHFLKHLVDADLASNQHGWQWAAGSGTDAAPYFRVFNPTTQGKRFDPDGTYVRRYVPELADVDSRHIHEPWTLPDGPPCGYPPPIVDHAEERREALARYGEIR